MRFDPDEGIIHLSHHLERMEESARTFGFAFNRLDIRNELQAAVFTLRQPVRVRLLLGRSGAVASETAPFPALTAERSEEHRSELQTRMRRLYDVLCLY